MSESVSALRARGTAELALLPPAAFAVHQLRYLLAYGGSWSVQLQRTGHSYLHSVVPWLVVLVALAVGGFLRAVGRAFSGHTTATRFSVSLLVLWVCCASALLAIFACQEYLEGLFATGHPAGLAGIFGYGGWWAIPAAACVGLVLAAYFHGARWAVAAVARTYGRLRVRAARPAGSRPRPVMRVTVPATPLGAGWMVRGPPRLS